MSEPAFSLARTVLQDFRYFESSDLDDTCARITDILQPHRLVPGRFAGPIRSHMDFLQLSGLGFCALKYSSEMHVEVTGLTDYHVLIFCMRGGASIDTVDSDIRIHANQGFASSAGRSFRASFSADCEQFIVRIDRKALIAHTGEADLRLYPQVDLERPSIAPWVRLMQTLFADRATLDLVRGNARIAAEYEQLLLSLLLEGHPHCSLEKRGMNSIAPAAVRRAEHFICDHFADRITLLDIARAAGVPPRTLLANFRRFRNVSPIRLLHEIRLDRARALLLKFGAERRVSHLASEAGFGHLGRFSRDYFARFGEYPSESAERAKRQRRRH